MNYGLAKLFDDVSGQDFKLAKDLMAIAMADGGISRVERKAITEIRNSEGISTETTNKSMHGSDHDFSSTIPFG